MTVVRRDRRPRRPRRTRGARTGMIALLALSAGAGCGQSLLRPNGGPGRAAESLGLAAEPIPGRKVTWVDPGQLPTVGAGPGRKPAASPTATAARRLAASGAVVSADGLTVETPSPMVSGLRLP